ncbi:MAG: WD40 repeat domain-containing protein, partial [Pseudomonadota bacterium]
MPTVAPYDFDSHVEWAGFIADEPVFATVEGAVHFPTRKADVFSIHDGLLSAVPTLKGDVLLSGGEDGRVVATTPSRGQQIYHQTRKWKEKQAAGPKSAHAKANRPT